MTLLLAVLALLIVVPLLVAGVVVALVERFVATVHFPAPPVVEDVQESDVVLCESCGLRPADKRVRLGGGLFAVCSSCAPARKAVAS